MTFKLEVDLSHHVFCADGCVPSPADVLFAERTGITITMSHVLADIRLQCLFDSFDEQPKKESE